MDPLYKFIGNPFDVEFLLKGKLKFTPIAQLNDPAELLANVIPEEVEASVHHVDRHGYCDEDFLNIREQLSLLGKLVPKLAKRLDEEAPSSKEEATQLIRSRYLSTTLPSLVQYVEEIAALFALNVGLLCLSKRNDSLPMWAHYAQNATGVVVEFRNLRQAFSGDGTGTLREPRSVQYENENSGVTFDPKSHESLFFSKFEDWSYEREVRIILALDDCDKAVLEDGRELHLFSIPPHHISRIFLGWRTDAKTADAVRDLVKIHNPSVEVVTTRIEKGQVIVV